MDLKVCEKEVLRYLKYNGSIISDELMKMIRELILEAKDKAKIRFVQREFALNYNENMFEIIGTTIKLSGKTVNKFLINSDKCVFIALTLGNDIEKAINTYSKTYVTKSLILDAIATTIVEEALDNVCDELNGLYPDYNLTMRFSPGYGDFDLNIQRDFLNVLDATKRIGLTVSSNNILIPRKSVTCIVGLTKENTNKKINKCNYCDSKDCEYRKKG